MDHARQFGTPIRILIIISSAGVLLWLVMGCSQASSPGDSTRPVPYVILLDDMGTILRIGVRSDVNDRQLQATLVKAADEHQDDAARDYLASMFLQVEAFLVRGGQQSRKFAGRLIRYVPPGNALEREKIRAGRREIDKFTDTLDEARRSFQ